KAKATTIKEALARWEEKTGQRPSEAKEIKLYAQIPPIEKMDASLSTLANCEKLSLSTNCIEKIANLNGLKNLRILSLGRNNIKNLNGLVGCYLSLFYLFNLHTYMNNFLDKFLEMELLGQKI
uniref:Dynein axonemal light chain 1 n=1 Tax=Saimiri boliviensis boliviensis TaxID=39432 RepID=A0A2K6TGJ1_SAIBB